MDRSDMDAIGFSGTVLGLALLTVVAATGVAPAAPALAADLSVSPGVVGAPGDAASNATCPYAAGAWHCSLKLTAASGSPSNDRWRSSSNGHATFSPSHGMLKSGAEVTVTVTVRSCGGNYLLNFTGPSNTAQATFTCG